MTGSLDFLLGGSDAGGFFGGPIEFVAGSGAIPEPGSAALLWVGALGLGLRRRRS